MTPVYSIFLSFFVLQLHGYFIPSQITPKNKILKIYVKMDLKEK